MSRYLLDTDWIVDALHGMDQPIRGALTRPLQQQIGDMDLLIAATAITHQLILVTRNVKDFQHIPRLEIYRPAGTP